MLIKKTVYIKSVLCVLPSASQTMEALEEGVYSPSDLDVVVEEPTVMTNEPVEADLPACFFFASDESREALALEQRHSKTASYLNSTLPKPGQLYLFNARYGRKLAFFATGVAAVTIQDLSCHKISEKVHVATWPAGPEKELVYVFVHCCGTALGSAWELATHDAENHKGLISDIPDLPLKYSRANLKGVTTFDWCTIQRQLGICFSFRRRNQHFIPEAGDVYVIQGASSRPLDGLSTTNNRGLYRSVFFDRHADMTFIHYYKIPNIIEID